MKPWRKQMWAGFVNGRLHIYTDPVEGRRAALFTSRARAKLAYEDVRRVVIEVRSQRKSAP